MDYTELSNSIRMMMKAQGADEKYIDKEETLYYLSFTPFCTTYPVRPLFAS